MKVRWLVLLAAGCVTGNPQSLDDERPELQGGTFLVSACGTSVTTRLGAAPGHLGLQRLVEPRLDLDLAKAQRRGIARRQQQRGHDRHSQFTDHACSRHASPQRL